MSTGWCEPGRSLATPRADQREGVGRSFLKMPGRSAGFATSSFDDHEPRRPHRAWRRQAHDPLSRSSPSSCPSRKASSHGEQAVAMVTKPQRSNLGQLSGCPWTRRARQWASICRSATVDVEDQPNQFDVLDQVAPQVADGPALNEPHDPPPEPVDPIRPPDLSFRRPRNLV